VNLNKVDQKEVQKRNYPTPFWEESGNTLRRIHAISAILVVVTLNDLKGEKS